MLSGNRERLRLFVFEEKPEILEGDAVKVPVSASRKGALDNGWKPHPVRNNQSTGSESWNRSGNVRFKRRQLGGRDGH